MARQLDALMPCIRWRQWRRISADDASSGGMRDAFDAVCYYHQELAVVYLRIMISRREDAGQRERWAQYRQFRSAGC